MKYSILLLNETDPQAPERNQLKIHSFSLTQFTPPPPPPLSRFLGGKLTNTWNLNFIAFMLLKI